MPSDSLDRLLRELEESKRWFGADNPCRLRLLLRSLGRRRFQDSDSLIRFHEALLFIRAYPQSREILELADKLLASFGERVGRLRSVCEDMIPFDYIENSGIAGTTLHGMYSYGIARWLAERHRASAEIDWERLERKERLGTNLPKLIPLLDEDSLTEANIPYLTWIHAAKKRRMSDLAWLIDRVEKLPLSEKEKSTFYDSLEIWIRWEMSEPRTSRTENIRAPRKVFYHRGPLIRRAEVSIATELSSSLPIDKLSLNQGKAILDMCRDTTCVRYRELYGIAYGDPATVVRANAGRGVEIFLWGLPAERRLPLRGYHSGFTLKNGVPINYIEGISLFERMELGFNTFYTFRDGETAWVYARILRALNLVTGATCFSTDPYQLGFNNDEAIESGAFWFYRKLGFRPTRPELERLAQSEERKIQAARKYRTPSRTLRRLSAGTAVYEAAGTHSGDWDRFHIRNLGLAVAKRMAREFDGDAGRIRAGSSQQVARMIGIRPDSMKTVARRMFEDLALVLALIPDLARWNEDETNKIAAIVRAKNNPDESEYLRRLQEHARLRQAIITLGSA
ncbi:MAG TPA: hypothetical protein VNS63_18285 [Blastocatellia bacterium]|nr:hypothetical protein [Blastocatellia bacterium]